jgi:iron complex outermembrane receptor protein
MVSKYGRKSILLAGSISVVVSTAHADDFPAPPLETTKQIQLEEVEVTAKFVATGAKSAMKQDVSVLDTPTSVDDYSNAFMKSVETTNVADLYNYMTGIQSAGATAYNMSIRGFTTQETDKNAFLVDGMPGLAGRFGSPPVVGTDHIEVVKGPASVLYGQQQPGGFLNIITKKPEGEASADLTVTGSAYDGAGISLSKDPGYTVDADFTGPFNGARTVLYRVILEDVHKDEFVDYSYEHSTYVAPSVTWFLSDTTSATLAAELRHDERTYNLDNYLIAPLNNVHLLAPITTSYQGPNDILPEVGHSTTFTVNHEFAEGVNWTTAVRNVADQDSAVGFDQNSAILLAATATRPAEWIVQRRARQEQNNRTYNFMDSNLSLPFKTGSVEHKVLVGANGGVDTTLFNRIQYYNGPTTPKTGARPGAGSINVDLYDPDPALSPPLTSFPVGTAEDRYTRSASVGAYVSDLITLADHWKATLGLREQYEQQHAADRYDPLAPTGPLTTNEIKSWKLEPTAGLMYEPMKSWTVYTDYSASSVPAIATAQNAAGVVGFTPTTAHQVEVGTKADLLDGRLTPTLAVYDIQDDNVLEPIACDAGVSGTCDQEVGAERSKGAELEVNGQLTRSWQVLFGYSYTDATITKSTNNATAPLVGDRLTNSSLNGAHLWTRYDIPSGPLHGLGFGIGTYYESAHAGTLASTGTPSVLVLPGYSVVDVAAYYSLFGRYNLTLKVGNVADRIYYQGVNANTGSLEVIPGSPRYILLSLRTHLY